MTKRSMIWTGALLIAGLAFATAPKDAPLRIAPAAAQTGPAALSEAQDVNGATGVVAEIVQCKRDSGVLSIRLRLRNTGDAAVEVKVLASGIGTIGTTSRPGVRSILSCGIVRKRRSRTRQPPTARSQSRFPRAAHTFGMLNIRHLLPRLRRSTITRLFLRRSRIFR